MEAAQSLQFFLNQPLESKDQILNYLVVDILETLQLDPTQGQINWLEDIFRKLAPLTFPTPHQKGKRRVVAGF